MTMMANIFLVSPQNLKTLPPEGEILAAPLAYTKTVHFIVISVKCHVTNGRVDTDGVYFWYISGAATYHFWGSKSA